MSDECSTPMPDRQKQLAETAASYTLVGPAKYEALREFQDSIATLRRKGASYRTIRDILHTVQVSVSLDTVARFCREVVEERPYRKTKRRSFVRMSSPVLPSKPTENLPFSSKPEPVREPPVEPNLRTKGPRIADPNNI